MHAIGRWAGTLAVAALASAGSTGHFSAPAWAQAQRSDEKNEPGQTYLTGDWGGLRSYLERNGVTLR